MRIESIAMIIVEVCWNFSWCLCVCVYARKNAIRWLGCIYGKHETTRFNIFHSIPFQIHSMFSFFELQPIRFFFYSFYSLALSIFQFFHLFISFVCILYTKVCKLYTPLIKIHTFLAHPNAKTKKKKRTSCMK